MNLTERRITNETQAIDYINWLVDAERRYHFDDTPNDILWQGSVSETDVQEMMRLHDELWGVVSPWELFERQPELWGRYTK